MYCFQFYVQSNCSHRGAARLSILHQVRTICCTGLHILHLRLKFKTALLPFAHFNSSLFSFHVLIKYFLIVPIILRYLKSIPNTFIKYLFVSCMWGLDENIYSSIFKIIYNFTICLSIKCFIYYNIIYVNIYIKYL